MPRTELWTDAPTPTASISRIRTSKPEEVPLEQLLQTRSGHLNHLLTDRRASDAIALDYLVDRPLS